MYQRLEVVRNKFSDDEIDFILKKLDYLIVNWKNIRRKKRLETILNLRDEIERWG